MGVGGGFWELLKPYALSEGPEFLREKRVAVDLSIWIAQHETAIKGYVKNPHLRLTFFRTINLFSKYGAYPVFVVDGTPSPLKAQARMMRFARMSGIDVPSSPVGKEGVSAERNHVFTKCVKECVELLELLGMPVLKARGEAEGLCAQLNREGHVDACITSDSDAFLYGAKCVIKSIRPNLKEPFECYNMSAIQLGLGLHRKHFIAISLLVGSDHDLTGVQGIGLDTAVPFIRAINEEEVLDRLHELSSDEVQHMSLAESSEPISHTSPSKTKAIHCSLCGHPGSKKSHLNVGCEYCIDSVGNGCLKKPAGFKCDCASCDLNHKEREKQKHENWKFWICRKIATEKNFPNNEIIEMYLRSNHGSFAENEGPCLLWKGPNTAMLVEYLSYHQTWEPSYTRQRMLPMFSTMFLRERVLNPASSLLCEQYELDSIQRVKVRLGQKLYVVRWVKSGPSNSIDTKSTDKLIELEEELSISNADECGDLFDESSAPPFQVIDGCISLLTDENIELVQAAFPKKVERFNSEEEMRQSKRKRKLDCSSSANFETPAQSVQPSIKDYFPTRKVAQPPPDVIPKTRAKDTSGGGMQKERKKSNSSSISKSVRRRLLFD